jgi:hypothetical protein
MTPSANTAMVVSMNMSLLGSFLGTARDPDEVCAVPFVLAREPAALRKER